MQQLEELSSADTGPALQGEACSADSSGDGAQPSPLMERVASGDVRAFRELAALVARPVRATARAMLRNRLDAEELAQEVLLELWLRASEYRTARGTLETWARTITRSRAIDRHRSEGARTTALSAQLGVDAGPHHASSSLESIEWIWVRDRLRQAFARLPGPQRRTLHLAYYSGLTQAEIAAQMKTSLGTVKTRARRGLALLSKQLVKPPAL